MSYDRVACETLSAPAEIKISSGLRAAKHPQLTWTSFIVFAISAILFLSPASAS